jgi:hypothetical protein
VHPTQVTCGVITLVIPLASLASLAVRKEGLVWRRVDSHPNLTRFPMNTVGMATQFMFTAKTVRVIIALWTFQPEHFSGRRPCGAFNSRRRIRSVDGRCCQDCLLWPGL